MPLLITPYGARFADAFAVIFEFSMPLRRYYY